MKVVFAHDHYFYTDDGEKYYSEIQFSESLWSRYLNTFDEIIVASRVKKGVKPDSMNVSSRSNVSFVKIPNMSSLRGKIKNNNEASTILEKLISSADALIVRLPSEIGCIAAAIAMRLGKPWAVEVVGHVWDSYWNYGSIQGKIYAPFATSRMKRIISKCPFAIYVTEYYLQKLYPCRGITSFASNVEIFPVSNDVLQQKLDRIQSEPKVLNIGLIGSLKAKYKGFATAFKALQLAQDKLPNIQFRILGAGNSIPWYKIAEKYGIEKSVVFCGSIPINEVPNWLEDIDLYIQPSQAEGLPRALVEAMSRGCPALGSTVAGIPELLNRSYLHRPLDSVSLSNLLVKVLNNKQLRMEMAKENFIRSQQYNKVIIDRRRGDFWMRFHDYVRDGGQ